MPHALSPMNTTLAFLVTGFPPDVSGVSHFNWERAQWFAKQGYRVVVFAPDWQNDPNIPPIPSELNNRLIVERYPSKPWAPYPLTHVPKFRAASEINEKIAYYQPDLITVTDVERFFVLSTWQLPGRGYVRKARIPYLAEYHTDLYNFSAAYPGWQWLRQTIRKLNLTSYLYRQFDLTLCPSTAASNSCQEMGVADVQTIPFYGIDVSAYSPTRRSRKCLEPWLDKQEQNYKVVLFLGRLAYEKRVDLLIEAFAKLKRAHPHCSLIITGDGPDDVVTDLKRLASQVDHVHFTGFIFGETKANLLASCDLFCSPCPYETFGRTIVEAMASGVPVVSVDSGAVSDYTIDGVNGYLVPVNDVDGLANGMQKALLSDNTKIIQRALQDANQFSFERGCHNLHNYYQKLLGREAVLN